MTPAKRIAEFERKHEPFYICDHGDGKYSLCLPFTFLTGKYENYCQGAFDRYAEEHGAPRTDKWGLHSYGNGYEWERVFKEAFRNDPDSEQIQFDCEAGGFFCNSKNLDVLERLGAEFQKICADEPRFQKLVNIAVPQEDEPDFGEEKQDFKLRM